MNPGLILAAHIPAPALMLPQVFQYSATGSAALAAAVPPNKALGHLSAIPAGGIARVLLDLCAGRYLTLEDLTYPVAAAIMLTFALVCAAALFHREQRPLVLFCAWVLALSVLLGWLGMVFRSLYFKSQYYVPLFGLFSILLSLCADRVRQRIPRAGPVLLAAYGIFSLALLTVHWTRLDRPENTKTIIAHVERQSRPGDFLNISPPYFFTIEHYWRGALPLHDFSNDFDTATNIHSNLFLLHRARYQLTEARMARWHTKLASRYKRVWMLWLFGARNTEDDTTLARRWMDRHYRRVAIVPFRQMPYTSYYTGELVLYEIRPLQENNP